MLAFRGTTVEWNDLLKPDSPLATDMNGVLGGRIVPQQRDAYEATHKAILHAKTHGEKLSLTGHSLGGWLAQQGGWFCRCDFDRPDVKVITFDSPGTARTFDAFKSNVQNSRTKLLNDTTNLHITNYVSVPNFVNSCNGQVGDNYALSVTPPLISLAREKVAKLNMPEQVKEFIQEKQFYLFAILSLGGHGIDLILEQFDPVTGKPRPDAVKTVQDWPVIKYNGTSGVEHSLLSQLTAVDGFGKNTQLLLKGIGYLSDMATIGCVLQEFQQLLRGNIDPAQYIRTHEILGDGANHEIAASDPTVPYNKQFSLHYEGHYKLVRYNPYGDIPPMDFVFVGRKNAIAEMKKYPKIVVQGQGGLGKTSLAMDYAYDAQRDGADVRWIAADSRDKVLAGLYGLAKESVKISNRTESDRKLVLIFDNLTDTSYITHLIDKIGQRVEVIITTRNSGLTLPGRFHKLALEPFTEEEARAYLTSNTDDNRLSETVIKKLLEKTGDGQWIPYHVSQALEIIAPRGKHAMRSESKMLQLLDQYQRTSSMLFEELNSEDLTLLKYCTELDRTYIDVRIISKLLNKTTEALEEQYARLAERVHIKVVYKPGGAQGFYLHDIVKEELDAYLATQDGQARKIAFDPKQLVKAVLDTWLKFPKEGDCFYSHVGKIREIAKDAGLSEAVKELEVQELYHRLPNDMSELDEYHTALYMREEATREGAALAGETTEL